MSTTTQKKKPLGGKSYGHIAHLPGSRMGPADHACHEGQKRIATEKTRDKHDFVVVQEKLDGSNVGVARINNKLFALTRAGYEASTSPFEQHWHFAQWVQDNTSRFMRVLENGERLCGEWLMQAHGTRYALRHEPFVVFDLFIDGKRIPVTDLYKRMQNRFVVPRLLHADFKAFSIEAALKAIETSGHGAIDPVEGAVWRVERNELLKTRDSAEMNCQWRVDFLAKYVRPEKQDGIYLPEKSGQPAIYNWMPAKEQQ